MSNTTETNPTPTVVTGEVVEQETSEKQSFVQKTKTFVQNHKKPTIAVGALVALTGVAAYLGRQTAPEIDSLDGPSPEAMEEAEAALVELGIPVTTEN